MTEKEKYTFHPSVLRAYDIRGTVGKTISEKDAFYIGKSFISFINQEMKGKGGRKVIVGYDGRKSSPILCQHLIKGLIESGTDVINIGLCPTPMLYFGVKHFEADAGIMITGSHNPPEYNGFKLLLKNRSVFGEDIQEIGKIAAEGKFITENGSLREDNIKEKYIKRILQDSVISRKLRVAWDCGNGVGGVIIPSLISHLQNQNFSIYDKVDANFPNHHPDPTIPENLQDLRKIVLKNKCDLGIAFDGDADRIGVVDGKGEILWGDQLLIIFAKEVLANHPGATIISEVKASQTLYDQISEMGGKPVMWKTGHSYIKEKLKEEKALLAGEMSGHIYFADEYYGYDDAIYSAIRLLSILSSSNKKLYEMRQELPKTFSTPELRIEVEEDRKFIIPEEIKKRLKAEKANYSTIDGVRVNTENGWWLVRASNTQPILVARCEGKSKEDLKVLKENLSNQLEQSGVEIK
jgi:phosphomannomutase